VTSIDQENEITVQFIDEEGTISTINKIRQKMWYDLHHSQFRYEADSATLEIIEKLNKTGFKLGNIYYVNYGAQISSKKRGVWKAISSHKRAKRGSKEFF
jgi:hypothetical protein